MSSLAHHSKYVITRDTLCKDVRNHIPKMAICTQARLRKFLKENYNSKSRA